jgi:enoyl-CoA hydratase/carnithine racemase
LLHRKKASGTIRVFVFGESAAEGDPEPAFGLPRLLEILLEGRVFGAEEALGKRLVNRVVPDYDLEPATYASARRIAEGAPLTARGPKQFVNRLMDPAPLTEAERDESYDCFATEDFQIGYHAFLAKKNPEFEGR